MAERRTTLAEKIAALRAAYAQELDGRLREIEAAAAPLAEPGSPEASRRAVAAIHYMAHKLAGSGATFGFAALTHAAQAVEEVCAEVIEDGEVPRAERCHDIIGLVVGLRSAVPRDAAVAPEGVFAKKEPEAPEAEAARTVVLVDADEDAARRLQGELANYGFATRAVPHADDLRAVLAEEAAAVVLFSSESGDGTDTLQALRAEGILDCPVIFLSERGSVTSRLEAVRAGGSAYLVKPVDVPDLVDAIDAQAASEDEEPYRILVVDDDRSVAGFIAAILEDAGMTPSVIDNPMDVLDRIQEFAPELILMDLYMPGCSGLELASVIRQQAAFAAIPIVFLSAEADIDKQLAAMRRGGDDFLNKSISAHHLIASVSARVQRFRLVGSLMVRDSMTGLFNHTSTKQLLDTELSRAERDGRPLALAVLDIDRFKSVNDTHGHPVGDRVIKSLARLLRQRLRRSDIIGRMGGEEFAVVLPGAAGDVARRTMDQVRQAFADIRHRADGGDFSVTVSCGVAEFPQFASAAALSEAADKALYAAKNGGRDRVVLAETGDGAGPSWSPGL